MKKALLSIITFLGVTFLIQAQEVNIGKQIWSSRNLDVSVFRNGDPIPQAKTLEEWESANLQNKPVWIYYDEGAENNANFGKLYNWYAVNDVRGLAPMGWRIPTIDDWNVLLENVKQPTNLSLFKPQAGGCLCPDGSLGELYYLEINEFGHWWSKTKSSGIPAAKYVYFNASSRQFNTNDSGFRIGKSVRCIKE